MRILLNASIDQKVTKVSHASVVTDLLFAFFYLPSQLFHSISYSTFYSLGRAGFKNEWVPPDKCKRWLKSDEIWGLVVINFDDFVCPLKDLCSL